VKAKAGLEVSETKKEHSYENAQEYFQPKDFFQAKGGVVLIAALWG
jgi:hypothetical protein